MLSGAGGALARRRPEISWLSLLLGPSLRAFFNLFFLFCNPSLLSSGSHGNPLHKGNIAQVDLANHSSLDWKNAWTMASMKEENYLSVCSLFIKSEISLPYIPRSKDSRTFAILVAPCIHRIPLKSILSSPRSLLEGSSALTSEPVKTLTADRSSLTLPSSSSIVSGPYTCGGAPISFSKEATLGFSILGLSLNFGPLLLFWPKTTNFSPATLLSRPRFVYCFSSPSPFTCSVWFHGLFRRSLCSCSEEEIRQEARSAEEDWKKTQVDSKKILAQPHQSATSNPSRQGADPGVNFTSDREVRARNCKPVSFFKGSDQPATTTTTTTALPQQPATIAEDIISLAKSFRTLSFRFISRSENLIADDLAKTASRSMTTGPTTTM